MPSPRAQNKHPIKKACTSAHLRNPRNRIVPTGKKKKKPLAHEATTQHTIVCTHSGVHTYMHTYMHTYSTYLQNHTCLRAAKQRPLAHKTTTQDMRGSVRLTPTRILHFSRSSFTYQLGHLKNSTVVQHLSPGVTMHDRPSPLTTAEHSTTYICQHNTLSQERTISGQHSLASPPLSSSSSGLLLGPQGAARLGQLEVQVVAAVAVEEV